jgi:sigma-B regulation protein RsbU (phosphoserine phosphatase)
MLLRVGGALNTLQPQGVACGMMAGLRPTVLRDELAPGDALLMFTDGVTEAVGESGSFGDDRLLALMRAAAGKNAQTLVSDLVDALAGHSDGFAAHDDVTVMAITRQA